MRNRLTTTLILIMILSGLTSCRENRASVEELLPTNTLSPTGTQILPTRIPGTTIAPTPTTTKPPDYIPLEDRIFSQDELIEDARQLAQIIEATHPDPYSRGGGKIVFHLRLNQLLEAIPQTGLRRDEFTKLLRPFLAAIGDSHTELWGGYQTDEEYPGGIPLRFGIVETTLYVAGTLLEDHQHLIGARLVSVEGIAMDELLDRQRALVPLENEYHVLEEMASHTLWYKPYLQDLLPEWDPTDQVAVTLQLSSGESKQVMFTLPVEARRVFWPQTQYPLPTESSSGFGYTMLDLEWKGAPIAFVRVDHMHGFREDAEARGETGQNIPSATETFRNLVMEMKDAGTHTLIIDLRANGGGSSLLSDILIYFLYGKEALNSIQLATLEAGGQVDRISELCFTPPNNIGKTLDEINEGRTLPIQLGGYDFSQFFSGDSETFEAFLAEMGDPGLDEWYQAAPTFWSEYASATYSGYYLPEHVIVLVSPWTFSSGLTMTRDLYRAGAVLVGTPSGQASNSFGNGLLWHLNNTGLEGQVTRSYFIIVPEESGLGQVLPVLHPLTYSKLASYQFDPNAEFLYALELLPELANR